VAYSVGGWYGLLLPGGRNGEEQLPRILRKTLRARRGDGRAAAHPSGVKIWLNDPKNRALVARADEPIRGELVAVLDLE
jgi:hypothetical protein